MDLGHNFVLAHALPCNLKKSDRIPAVQHLEAWVNRNGNLGLSLSDEFDRRGIIHDLPTSVKVARWAYSQVETSGGLTWKRGEEMVALHTDWKDLFLAV